MQGVDSRGHHRSQEPTYRMRPVMSPSIRGGLMIGTHGRHKELKEVASFRHLPSRRVFSRTLAEGREEHAFPQPRNCSGQGAQNPCSFTVDARRQQREAASIPIGWLHRTESNHVVKIGRPDLQARRVPHQGTARIRVNLQLVRTGWGGLSCGSSMAPAQHRSRFCRHCAGTTEE